MEENKKNQKQNKSAAGSNKNKQQSQQPASCTVGKFKQRSHDTHNDQHIPFLLKNTPEIILIGTSMFERFQYDEGAVKAWKEFGLDKCNVGNFGVGGDKIENIIYRLQNLELFKHFQKAPKAAIIMAGANDVENKKLSPEFMFEGLQQIVKLTKTAFPECQIHVLGMFPRTSDKIPEQDIYLKVVEYNRLLSKMEGIISYSWFGNELLKYEEVEGLNGKVSLIGFTVNKFFVDNVHLSYEGYSIFAKGLQELIHQKILVQQQAVEEEEQQQKLQ